MRDFDGSPASLKLVRGSLFWMLGNDLLTARKSVAATHAVIIVEAE